ncbi:ABC transporter ATP-binding protein [Synoicihabitans lomoniglobus]|uniref:ABC transporter ATP-binding protein n=1 Tax=Synoicihabitans lomoniglobus TaxID=2909285 RepID=A0AAF0I3L6_9BACT|nr:ABC transporter ATP-binding protein/permease [Opitutaceae bacterium LMO-M01]WED66373.1 ABC transporter ATP-binding protein [Opitutaceae bacterium LMO-M01]
MGQFQRLRPYFRYLKAVRQQIAIAIFCAIVYGVSSGAALPALTEYVFPKIFSDTGGLPMGQVILIAAAIPLAFLLRAVSGYLQTYFTQSAGVRILEFLRLDYFGALQRLPLSFVQNRQTGDLISRGLADTAQLQFTLTQLANDGVKQPVVLVAALGYLTYLGFTKEGVPILLLGMLVVPLSVLPIRYIGRKVIKRAQQFQAQLGSVTGIFSENLSAAREVRAFGLEERETQRFSALTSALVISQMKIVKYAQALSPAIEFLAATGIGLTFVLAYETGVGVGTFNAIIIALYMAYDPIKKIGNLNNELKRGTAALERLEVVLNEPVAITDPETPTELTRARGDLAFENVAFAYRDGELVLRDVDVRIPAGTVCALVGPSGAGKSTFANLVPRFYEVGSGAVKIDGIDVRDFRLNDLRQQIAIVSQEAVLFNDTVYANILLSRPQATRQQVQAAAEAAFAHDFITALPNGYDTMVGERGAALSGGQRQRLALARAFLRDAPILILDEATSALDSESEAFIQQALRKLVVGKTVLIIAHRFSTIRDASKILVFDRGELAASGTHAELIADNPLYRTLYERQATLTE